MYSRFRVRVVRQSCERPSRHPGDERFPDRYEEAQGPAEETEGREQALLTVVLRTGHPGQAA